QVRAAGRLPRSVDGGRTVTRGGAVTREGAIQQGAPSAEGRQAPRERVGVRVPGSAAETARLLDECRRQALELLHRNLTPAGIAAATPTERSARRCYTAIFGRDAAICAFGM